MSNDVSQNLGGMAASFGSMLQSTQTPRDLPRERRPKSTSIPSDPKRAVCVSGIAVQTKFTSLPEVAVEKDPSDSQLLLSIDAKKPVRVPEPKMLMIPSHT